LKNSSSLLIVERWISTIWIIASWLHSWLHWWRWCVWVELLSVWIIMRLDRAHYILATAASSSFIIVTIRFTSAWIFTATSSSTAWIPILMYCCCCNSRHLNPFFHWLFHFIIISTIFTDDAINNRTHTTEHNKCTNYRTSVILCVIWWILIISVLVIVEVIAVAIIINNQIKSGIVANCVIIIQRSIIHIEWMIGSSSFHAEIWITTGVSFFWCWFIWFTWTIAWSTTWSSTAASSQLSFFVRRSIVIKIRMNIWNQCSLIIIWLLSILIIVTWDGTDDKN